MQFFTSAIDTLQTLVVQLMAGGGIILLGTTLIPLLSGLF